jgi:hypothetical protein
MRLAAVVIAILILLAAPVALPQHTEPPDPTPPTFAAAFLLPSSSLTLQGVWESLWTLEIVSDTDARIASPDRFVVPAETITELLEGSTEVPLAQVPSDCRLCVKWRATDGDTWYTSGYREEETLKREDGALCGCGMSAVTNDGGLSAPSLRRVYAVYEFPHVRGTLGQNTKTGDGELRLFRDEGKIELACADHDHDGTHAVLAAISEVGDVYFFLVKK